MFLPWELRTPYFVVTNTIFSITALWTCWKTLEYGLELIQHYFFFHWYTYTLPESLLMLPILPSVESLLGCLTSPRPDNTSSLLWMELFFFPSVSWEALLLRRWRPINDPILWPKLGRRLRPSVTHDPTSESDILPLVLCFWKPCPSCVGVRTVGCCCLGIVDLVFIFSLNWLK